MPEFEKLEILRGMADEEDERVLLTYLRMAAEIILNRIYPFGSDRRRMPDKYDMTQIEIACYLLNKRGAEGETSHSENGISRGYESASVPDSMLVKVTPFVGVI